MLYRSAPRFSFRCSFIDRILSLSLYREQRNTDNRTFAAQQVENMDGRVRLGKWSSEMWKIGNKVFRKSTPSTQNVFVTLLQLACNLLAFGVSFQWACGAHSSSVGLCTCTKYRHRLKICWQPGLGKKKLQHRWQTTFQVISHRRRWGVLAFFIAQNVCYSDESKIMSSESFEHRSNK